MKISTLLTAGLYLLLMSRSFTAAAADPRFNTGYNAAPNRGLFGLPMPQQWSGARPSGMNSGLGNSGYRQTGYDPTEIARLVIVARCQVTRMGSLRPGLVPTANVLTQPVRMVIVLKVAA
jgi:hypothetical protein